MTDEKHSPHHPDDQGTASTKKENNLAKRKSMEIKLTGAPRESYQGGPPDNRRAPGVEEDTDTEEPDERK